MPPTVAELHRTVRRLQLYVSSLTLLLLVASVAAFLPHRADVLRVRGIIVEDDAGRDRILIGAPIPASAARVRTDTARARKAWAGGMPKQYMTWYAGYRNAMNGVLVLDERGFDRLAIGDSVPDPNIGKRIGPSTGLVINDSLGFERTGYGLLSVGGKYRVSLGFDPKGEEGLGLTAFDDGGVALWGRAGGQQVFVGGGPAFKEITGRDDFVGMMVKKGGVAKTLEVAKPEP